MIHCLEDYDERLNCVSSEHKYNLTRVLESILVGLGISYIWYDVPEAKLRKYTTLKADNEKK